MRQGRSQQSKRTVLYGERKGKGSMEKQRHADQPLWTPSAELMQQATMTQYMQWLAQTKDLHVATREALWRWSVTDLEAFWASIWEFFHVRASQPYSSVLGARSMPGAVWFPGARLNFAEHIFLQAHSKRPAILFRSERHAYREVSWSELTEKVGALAQSLRDLGVTSGDRVVSYMPNIPETVIAFLACASLGAIWSSCSPDFGPSSVIERFKQIEPKVLFAVDGYQYNGKRFDRRAVLAELQRSLPTLQATILFPYLQEEEGSPSELAQTILWQDLLAKPAELRFEQVPFDHPLWVLYSSGTTGLPKALVQGHGGILLEHLKALALDLNLKPDDRFFWFSTTGWMMWNLLISGLLVGAVVMLYDGSPAYPDYNCLWQLAQEMQMTFFGTSASYIAACMKAGIEPGQRYDLSALQSLGSTGSPLPPEGFRWVYQHVKQDLWLASISGGTDVCSAFVGGSVLLPVYAGELQCRSLGASVDAVDEQGNSLIDEVGELVLREPMPSMPLFFWNDPDGRRYRESYFGHYPGIWRHGDWIRITSSGSAVISGRSDTTLNRMGIRMGSSELYRVVESLPEILDSLVVGLELSGGRYYMPLFVVLRDGVVLDDVLKRTIKEQIRKTISPHHVPDEILAIPEVPRTLSGKKLELPVKKLLQGIPKEKAISTDAMANPQALASFVPLAEHIKALQ